MALLKDTARAIVDTIIRGESLLHLKAAPAEKKRVLIFRKDGLGDCILFYPTLAAYRRYFADAEVTLILPKWFQPFESLLTKFKFDHVIWFDHIAFSKSFCYRRKFLLDLTRAGYDTTVYPVFTREATGNFMMKMTGAKEIRINIPAEIKNEFDRNVYIAEKITGIKNKASFPTINLSELPEGKTEAESLLKKNGLDIASFAIIFPGAGADYRIWPSDRFAKIIDYISIRGITPVICGSPKEKELVQSILKKVFSSTKAIDLSGQTSLPVLTHLISHATFYFGSDTGILHIAAAVGTPAVALVGSGGYERFFPYGDLKKNRALIDSSYMKNNPEKIGNWDDAKKLGVRKIHPSILGISVENAQKEVDYMIEFVLSQKSKNNEKDN